MNNDRIKSQDADHKLPKPEVSIIKNGNSVFKPGMKTYFVESKEGASDSESSGVLYTGKMKTVTETVCVCNKVCTCNPQCTCESNCTCNPVCRCQSVSTTTTCSCNKVCTCQSVSTTTTCSCNKVCACNPQGTVCSCNEVCTCLSVCSCQSQGRTYCSCVPVH